MSRAFGKPITAAEEAQLRFSLGLSNAERAIKKGLQELCNFYEARRFLIDPTDIRQLIHSHLGSQNILLRRWSLKALGLIGHRDDTVRIVERLRVETDVEAQTWGAAALLTNADDRGLREICSEANLEQTTALSLAARLYAPISWLKRYPETIRVSVDDDELTLKWATFLVGYNRAPADMFHPRHANPIFLGLLNTHPAADISEYSIWAMWERDEFGVKDLSIKLEDVSKHPASVRKWLYRLMLKDPVATGLDIDSVGYLYRREADTSAREGLAAGVSGCSAMDFSNVMLEWYHGEADPAVKEALLAGIARRSSDNAELQELVVQVFRGEQPGGGVRKRLLAAAAQQPVSAKILRIEAEDAFRQQGLLEFDRPNLTIIGDVDMSNKTSFTAGGHITGQVLAGGNVVNSANSAVQNLDQSRSADKDVLEAVLSMVAELEMGATEAAPIMQAVSAVAAEPSKANKRGLLDVLKGIGSGTEAASRIAAHVGAVIGTVSDWIDI